MSKNYYKILGLSRDASEQDIKQAYRKLARQHHPDANPNDIRAEERFKEVNEAYEVLSDPQKRAKYDQFGSDWRRWEQGTGGFDWGSWANTGGGPRRSRPQYGNFDEFDDAFANSPFASIFGNMFNEGRTRPTSSPHRDLEHEITISLTEAYHGTARVLRVNGKRLEVKIPAGADTGTKIRLRGQGNYRGDLLLKVKVAEDPRFERKADDLHVTVSSDIFIPVLGGELRIPTITGEVLLRVPPGSQNGQTFRLRGKGMPKLQQANQHGDLYARLEVELPTDLSARQRDLFEQLRRNQ